jgi:hypothetical protein
MATPTYCLYCWTGSKISSRRISTHLGPKYRGPMTDTPF